MPDWLISILAQVTIAQWLAIAAGIVITIGVTEGAKYLPFAPSRISKRYTQWIQLFAFVFGTTATAIVWPDDKLLHRIVFGVTVGIAAPFVYFIGKFAFRKFFTKKCDR